MVEKIKRKLAHSPSARWIVLAMVSLTMFAGYFLCDVMAPLKNAMTELFGWDNTDFGIFNSGYGWLNVFLLMLIFGGILLDRWGPRRTGVLAVGVMVIGIAVKYYAVAFMDGHEMSHFWFFGERAVRTQVLLAAAGFAIFALGYEVVGITATKIIVRWFKGRETALALGLNVSLARLGSALAMIAPVPLYKWSGSIGFPILFGLVLLAIGFVGFMVYVVIERDATAADTKSAEAERFHLRDVFTIFAMRGFWYVAMLCLLFYSAIFPFLKYAPDIMMQKFGISESWSGFVPSLLPFGAILLTPLFGNIYDRRGKGATMMILGSLMLVFIYSIFAIPAASHWLIAAGLVIAMGIAFSLVPSAMWPSVPKMIPERKLGTAYALIFWIQNVGLSCVPLLIGWMLDRWGTLPPAVVDGKAVAQYDYTLPMLAFLCISGLAVLFGLLLKREDRLRGYGLEKPNITTAA